VQPRFRRPETETVVNQPGAMGPFVRLFRGFEARCGRGELRVELNTDGTMARTTTLPGTQQAVRAWLKGTEQGRALLARLTGEAFEEALNAKCRACENIRPYPRVLIVLRRLGNYPGSEAYVDEGVSVRLVELPEISDRAEADGLVEEWIAERVPKSWRHLVRLPARRIHSEVFRGVSLAETLRYGELLDDIKTIKSMEDGK